jgi:hypothetical protein
VPARVLSVGVLCMHPSLNRLTIKDTNAYIGLGNWPMFSVKFQFVLIAHEFVLCVVVGGG